MVDLQQGIRKKWMETYRRKREELAWFNDTKKTFHRLEPLAGEGVVTEGGEKKNNSTITVKWRRGLYTASVERKKKRKRGRLSDKESIAQKKKRFNLTLIEGRIKRGMMG